MTAEDQASQKARIRAELRTRRCAVSARERAVASRRITDKLVGALDWAQVGSLHIYRSVPAWGEIDTDPTVAFIGEHWPEIEVVSPTLAADQPVAVRPFDVIVVPVLGFDDANMRLGLGAGFYDRFLAGQPQATKIGLAYAWSRVTDRLPCEPHDVPLDAILTDE